MTNEQKLIKLLQIAAENGWKLLGIFDKESFEIEIDDTDVVIFYEESEYVKRINLNDLILNWEEGQIGFIEALCEKNTIVTNTNTVIIDSEPEVNLYSTYFPVKDITQYYQFEWVSLPTSQRIEYLFRIFKHLL